MKLLGFSLLLCVGFISNAQKSPIKFGEISKADMTMTVYDKDGCGTL